MTWARLCEPWRAAIDEGWDAYRAGTNPVGAVVCDASGRIVARGRNRILDTAVADGQLNGTRLAHAEVNALLRLQGMDARGMSLAVYTTVEPCPLCVGAIVMVGIREIHYASRDPWAGCAALLDQNAYLASKRIARHEPFDVGLERALKALSVESMLRRGLTPRGQAVIASFRALLPDAVAAGEHLYATKELAALARAGAGAAEALDLLDRSVRLMSEALEGPSTPSRRKKGRTAE